jgi:hypothetical protein
LNHLGFKAPPCGRGSLLKNISIKNGLGGQTKLKPPGMKGKVDSHIIILAAAIATMMKDPFPIPEKDPYKMESARQIRGPGFDHNHATLL